MEEYVVLNELEKSKCLIESFLLRDGSLVLVEPEQIRKAVYSHEITYDQMETITTTGYNVGASVYWEPLNGIEYLLILKDCGTLELLNSQCERIDVLETGIEQTEEKKLFAFDDRNNQIFINLRGNSIFAISYRLKKNQELCFIKKEEDLCCVFEDVDKIVSMEISWNIDYMTGRDFSTISMVLFNEVSQEHYFQVIKPTPEKVRKNKVHPWEPFIGYSLLEVDAQGAEVVLKAVSNVGFFIFGQSQVLFIKLPGGNEQTVEGMEFQAFENFDGCYITYGLPCVDKINLNGGVILRKDVSSLEFLAFNSKNQLVKMRLKLIFEDPDELIYHWASLSIEMMTVECIISDRQIINRTIMLSNSVLLLLCGSSSEVIFLDLDQVRIITSLRYDFSKTFFSSVVGSDFHKLVNCGQLSSNKGFIESKFLGHSNFFTLIESYNSEHEVLQLWVNKSGVWWRDSKGGIFCNGKLIETCALSVHIGTEGIIVKNNSIVCWCDISNDLDGNYAYVSSEGYIGWSDETETFPLRTAKSPSLAKYVLTCIKLKDDNSKITVLSIDNELMILQNTRVLRENFDLSNDLDTISSICIVKLNESLRLLISDIDGKLNELDIKTLKIFSRHKIGRQRADICAIDAEGPFLIYTKDDLLLLHSTDAEKFRFTRIEMESRIDKITAHNSSVAILTDDSEIRLYKFPSEISLPRVINKRIDSDSYIHTKFIFLPCSTRYLVTSSLRSAYNDILQRVENYNEIQLHDLERRKTVFQYDLSERYPQAFISDIVAVPFNKRPSSNDNISQNSLYAMQLAFDKVFVVSLNYEMAEDESLDNLLLFSIDPNKGTIEFLQGIETGYSITALLNYHNRILFVAGEILQAYRVDYLLKENTFKIESASNGIPCSGLIKTIVKLPDIVYKMENLAERKGRKLRKTLHIIDQLLVLNVLKGLSEYTLIHNPDSTLDNLRLRIVPVANSEKSSFLSLPNINGLVSHMAICQIDKTTWLLTGSTDRFICLRCIPHHDEPSFLQLKLPGNIISINSILKDYEHSGLITQDSLVKSSSEKVSMLFAVNTSKGKYLLGKLEDSNSLGEFKKCSDELMEEQFRFIQLEDEQSDLIFIDTRIWKEPSLKESFERSML